MSYALLCSPYHKNQDLADDLEAFFWVLIYHILRFRPTVRKNDGEELYIEFSELFDQYSSKDVDGSEAVGGRGKQSFFYDLLFCDEQIDLSVKKYGFPEPLACLIGDFRYLFSSFYSRPVVNLTAYGDNSVDDDDDEAAKRRAARKRAANALKAAQAAAKQAEKEDAIGKLSSHTYFLEEIRSALSKRSRWPKRDYALDHLPGAGKFATRTATNNLSGATSGKRKRASVTGSKKRSKTSKSLKKSLQDSRHPEEEGKEEVADEDA
ncbi:hypothetical protein OF83DRAFT_228905 [Amylostereum chailletii]|nr:hypothetical protein OF83DRAFT_228905 [Amylostereum chailletii]